jgi:hypothetical protein
MFGLTLQDFASASVWLHKKIEENVKKMFGWSEIFLQNRMQGNCF